MSKLALCAGMIDDFALVQELADPNIIPAKYGGGDFVTAAWPGWFAMDERAHISVFAFAELPEQKVVGFERCELYGDPDAPDTGARACLHTSIIHFAKHLLVWSLQVDSRGFEATRMMRDSV